MKTRLIRIPSSNYRTLDIYRTAEYILFSTAHGTFTKIDHMFAHKASQQISKKLKFILHHICSLSNSILKHSNSILN